MKKIFVAPHQHFDIIWRRTYGHYVKLREQIILRVFDLLKIYPQFRFFISQAVVVRMFLKQHPELKEEFINYLKDGRIEIVSGMETLPDLNMVSGESIVRNIISGRGWFEKELNASIKIASFMDAFGMNAQIPQILKKAGYNYLVPGRMPNVNSDLEHGTYGRFIWEGLDGTRIIGVLGVESAPGALSETSVKGLYGWGIMEGEDDEYEKHKERKDVMVKAIKEGIKALGQLNGKEVYFNLMGEEHLPNGIFIDLVAGKDKKSTRYIFVTPRDYFSAVEKNESNLPVLKGEFNPTLTGCYTTRIRVKQKNRRLETLLAETEKLACMAHLYGKEYPISEFQEIWKEVYFCQFHDGICGCHNDDTFKLIMKKFDAALKQTHKILDSSLQFLVSMIDTRNEGGDCVVIFNTLNWARKDVVRLNGVTRLRIFDEQGKEVPIQRLNDEILFVADVTSLGYKSYRCKKGNISSVKNVSLKDTTLHTCRYQIGIQHSLLHIYDKELKQNLIPENTVLAGIRVRQDKGTLWTENFTGQEVIPEDKLKRVEEGDVFIRAEYEGELKYCPWHGFQSLEWRKEIFFYKDIDRIDIRLIIDWKGCDTEIAVLFPINIDMSKSQSWYGIPFGMVKRQPYYKEEEYIYTSGSWPALLWADYGNSDRGVTISDTGTPGYSMEKGVIGISILRSPSRGKVPFFPLKPEKLAYDNGRHEFSFSVVPHTGDFRKVRSYRSGWEINAPFLAVRGKSHAGGIPDNYSFIAMDSPNIICSSCKISEDGETLIIRLYETEGKVTTTTLNTAFKVEGIWETNLLEEIYNTVEDRILNFGPFEIKTLKVAIKRQET